MNYTKFKILKLWHKLIFINILSFINFTSISASFS